MSNPLRKLFFLVFIFSLFIPLELERAGAVTSTTLKTVEFFIGQDEIVRSSGEQISFPFTVTIPESPEIRSALIEISGAFYNDSGKEVINVDLKKGSTSSGAGLDYTIGGTAKTRQFSVKYDGSSIIQSLDFPGVQSYTLYLKGSSEVGAGFFSIFSAKLVLTYNCSVSETKVLKTSEFFVLQEAGKKNSGEEVAQDFTVSISEPDPLIQSVFIEISGIAKGSGAGTIEASVVNKGQPPNYKPYTLDLSPLSSTFKFIARHNAFSNINSADFPGVKNYTLCLNGTGFSTNLWNAKIIITYEHTEISSGLPILGYVISSTVDTGITRGAAFNSLMWKGSLNGGKVRLQFAASNCQGGQSDYPLCSSGNWGDINTPYRGVDCTSATSYETAPDTSSEIRCAAIHNNKRYFRYKAILCSNDCVVKGFNSPEVTDIIVNWSP